MSESITLSSPVYQFPFDDAHLAVIGGITLMWGQIDSQVDDILMSIYKLDRDTFDHLFSGKMVGPKSESLKIGIRGGRNADASQKIVAMADAIKACVADRNTLTHGLWGWSWEKKEKRWRACAWSQSKGRYFYQDEIGPFYNQVATAAGKADAAWHAQIIGAEPPPTVNRRMMFADGPPEGAPPPVFAR